MKKRTVKKLSLNRETLRTIADKNLHEVVGGGNTGRRSCPEASCGKGCSDIVLMP